MESLVKLACTLAQLAVTGYFVLGALLFLVLGLQSGPLGWLVFAGLGWLGYKIASYIVQGLDRVKEKLS